MAFTSVNRLYFSSIQKSLGEDFSSLDKSFHAGVIVLRTHSHLAGIKCHICANQKAITHCHPDKLNSYVAKTLMRKLSEQQENQGFPLQFSAVWRDDQILNEISTKLVEIFLRTPERG